ncbi:MAG TPA: hypothetical protein PLE74_12200 [Candidatus Cloacimonadota bacterium]|nr:hypothetical protein [Candidatus Cloacimonadota bacterium]
METILTEKEIIVRIINLNVGLEKFWSSSKGWAPIESAQLLSKSRLDWQSSLSRTLVFFLDNEIQKEDGALIMAWAVLGSLVEGTLKLFLSIYYTEYNAEELHTDNKVIKSSSGKLISPDELALEKLKQFFALRIYPDWIRKHWKDIGEEDWIKWIDHIQARRNAIHAFKERPIGTFKEFFLDVRKYLYFLRRISNTFPYLDDEYYKL